MTAPTIVCKTQWHIIVAHLWQQKDWIPTHLLQGRQTDFGFIRSSGEQRVRELARNDPTIPEELRDKVEKKRDGKYEYFRYRQQPKFTPADNAALLKFFDEYPVPPPVIR